VPWLEGALTVLIAHTCMSQNFAQACKRGGLRLGTELHNSSFQYIRKLIKAVPSHVKSHSVLSRRNRRRVYFDVCLMTAYRLCN